MAVPMRPVAHGIVVGSLTKPSILPANPVVGVDTQPEEVTVETPVLLRIAEAES
ncbi:hypothetical protein [Nocardia salmonicida]|uniref:hypothetical protein n=1 Tax=Nocardia salmonicida TaxID=53431 RepID=UPI0037A55CCE